MYLVFSRGKAVFDESGKFGDDAFRAISSNWDVTEFRKYEAPEIEQQNGKNAVPDLLARLKDKLGPLKGTFSSHVTGFNAKNGATYADWNADANFEKASGAVTIQLVNRNDKWQILKFDVDSAALK